MAEWTADSVENLGSLSVISTPDFMSKPNSFAYTSSFLSPVALSYLPDEVVPNS